VTNSFWDSMRAYKVRSLPAVSAARTTEADTRIIMVDDNTAWCFEMVRYFESFDIRATSVSGWLELHRRLSQPGSYLVILDLQLAREGGLDLLRKIHSLHHVPVILTGARPNDIDGILGLERGADDYLSKPLSPRELIARARAILRRKQSNDVGPSPHTIKHRRYSFNGWTLDRHSRTLRDETGNSLALTKGEFSLLIAFLEKPQQTLTRLDLMQAVRVSLDTTDRSIDVTVMRLRRKLQSHPGAPQTIETVRGVGYNFNAIVEPL
jgi:two-component system, OmpR family, response regulator